jgi:hypothetical protein
MAELPDTTNPSRRSILSRIGALPAFFGGGLAAEAGTPSVQAENLNRPYSPIEAAYAVSQYIDFDPALWLDQCRRADVPINTAEGFLGIGFSFGNGGQRIDNSRARFLNAWLGVVDDDAVSRVVGLIEARRAREYEGSLDPILMAIKTHREARQKMVAIGHSTPDGSPEYDAAENHETALFDKLVTIEPVSLVGAAQLAAYVADYPKDEMKPGNVGRVLRTLHSALLEMHAQYVEA